MYNLILNSSLSLQILRLFFVALVLGFGISACTQTSDSKLAVLEGAKINPSAAPEAKIDPDQNKNAKSSDNKSPASKSSSEISDGDENELIDDSLSFADQQKKIIETQRQFFEEQQAKQKQMIEEAQARIRASNPSLAKPTEKEGDDVSKGNPNLKQPPKSTGKNSGKVLKASVGGSARAGANVILNAPWKCVPASLKSVINEVARRYGPVIINSTHRTSKRNRRVGGAKGSYHLRCQAVDFRVKGNSSAVLRFLRNHRHVGGLKRYRSGFFHIDNGPRRTWRG